MSTFALPHLLEGSRWKGMRVGLLGGSFNPPHEGHVHISLAALKGLKLDAVWWLVTPQNPLKQVISMPLEERVFLSRSLVHHPRIFVTDLENTLGTNITCEVVSLLTKRFASTDFVWISGMDNALNLHRWNRWRELLGKICMVHMTRPPAKSIIRRCPLRMLGNQRHVIIDRASSYPLNKNTTYWMLQNRMVDTSSTDIRNKISPLMGNMVRSPTGI